MVSGLPHTGWQDLPHKCTGRQEDKYGPYRVGSLMDAGRFGLSRVSELQLLRVSSKPGYSSGARP